MGDEISEIAKLSKARIWKSSSPPPRQKQCLARLVTRSPFVCWGPHGVSNRIRYDGLYTITTIWAKYNDLGGGYFSFRLQGEVQQPPVNLEWPAKAANSFFSLVWRSKPTELLIINWASMPNQLIKRFQNQTVVQLLVVEFSTELFSIELLANRLIKNWLSVWGINDFFF